MNMVGGRRQAALMAMVLLGAALLAGCDAEKWQRSIHETGKNYCKRASNCAVLER